MSSFAVEDPEREGPFHVLMLGPGPEGGEFRDPKLDRDYLARRHKCFQKAKKRDESGAEADQDENDEDEALWAGASPLERGLIECCELESGVISRGKEVAFLGLVAGHCHNTASQALALAILQRTLERPNDEEDDESSSDADYENDSEYESGDDESEASIEEKEGDSAKDTGNNDREEEALSNNGKEENTDRISTFLSGGGLLILRDWLVDSTTPVSTTSTPMSSSPTATANKTSRTSSPTNTNTRVTNPPTGPILLPLLSLLESIPFHKKLVTETKINKNIRNLKRQLDAAVTSFGDGETKRHASGDKVNLEEWRHPVAGGNVVVQVQKAVELLMQTWQEKARDSTSQSDPEGPFLSLRNTLRDRLGILLQCEDSPELKPEWLVKMEESDPKKSSSPPTTAKLTTHQLEALEHKKERERIRDAMKKTQQEREEAKEKLEQLKRKFQEQSLKRKSDKQMHVQEKRRKVTWKDGLNNSVSLRRRHLLEIVHEYPADPGDDGSDAGIVKNEKVNVENESNVEMPGDQDDPHFMFKDGMPLANNERSKKQADEVVVKNEEQEEQPGGLQ